MAMALYADSFEYPCYLYLIFWFGSERKNKNIARVLS